MSLIAPTRIATLALVLAGSCLALPAFAAAPTRVTFQPNSHWAQEIGTVNKYDHFLDYAVAIPADKILQVNLVTRDPNVYFKVTDATHDKQLVDTFKTGATTWSAQPATTPVNYTIHVYVDPVAMQMGEKAKYALQIGQYGQADLQPATTAVTFEPGKPWVQAVGTLDAQGTARDYTVSIGADQMLAVNLITHNPNVHFKVVDQASGQTLIDNAKTDTTQWSTPVATATQYTINVYADPSAMPPGSRAGYAVQIGRYAQHQGQPATAGSTAPPPVAASTAAPPATSSAQP